MPPPLVTIMHAYLAERAVADDELMFRTKNGTRPDMANWRRALRRACHHAGIPVLSPYDLRHACATTWLRGSVPLGEAARRLGHSVKTLVTHYIQALDGDADIAN